MSNLEELKCHLKFVNRIKDYAENYSKVKDAAKLTYSEREEKEEGASEASKDREQLRRS